MKKLVINTEAMRPVLKKLSQAINPKPVIPSLSNLYLRAREGEVELITSDQELTISYVLPCECKQEFEMLIPFGFISDLIGLLGNQPIEIQQHPGNKGVIIAEGESHQLGLEKVKDYPAIPDAPVKNKMELDKEFMEWLQMAMATVGKDDLRPAMTQALLELGKEGVTIVSTDSHSLFRRFFKKTFEGNAEDILISPRVAKAVHGFEKATLSWRQNHIALAADKITVIATRLDAKFPHYRSVIPNSNPTLELNREDLMVALSKACLFNKRQVAFQFPAGVTDKFNVAATDADMERFSEVTVQGKYTGKTDNIAFSPLLFKTILTDLPFDVIRLHIDGPKRGVVITAEDQPDYLGMIMPLINN